MATKKKQPKKRVFKVARKGKSTDGMEKWEKGMAAAHKANKGNQWWNLRSKHGRDKIFATPQIMWEAAVEYFQAVDDNPLEETKPIVRSLGGDMGSEIVDHVIPHKRPYTIQGLCLYLHVNTAYFRNFKLQNKDLDFNAVIQDIEDVIYRQKFEGASSGFFNANLISRDLGLAERSEVDMNLGRKSVADVFPDSLDHDSTSRGK